MGATEWIITAGRRVRHRLDSVFKGYITLRVAYTVTKCTECSQDQPMTRVRGTENRADVYFFWRDGVWPANLAVAGPRPFIARLPDQDAGAGWPRGLASAAGRPRPRRWARPRQRTESLVSAARGPETRRWNPQRPGDAVTLQYRPSYHVRRNHRRAWTAAGRTVEISDPRRGCCRAVSRQRGDVGL